MALHSKTSFYSQRSSTEPPAFNTMINGLAAPTRNLTALAREERHFTFSHFTCEHAWVIGNILRNALRTADCACLIDISLPALTLFHAPSMPGVMPDSELWVQKKKNTVLRWGHSTWYMGCAFDWDYKRFAEYHAMSGDEWAKYTIEGGGYPVFVKGVEGSVGSIVVVGVDSEQAHGLVVQAIKEYRELREGAKGLPKSMSMS